MKKGKWINIEKSGLEAREVWKCEKCGGTVRVKPGDEAENGVPFCPDCDRERTFVRTEVRGVQKEPERVWVAIITHRHGNDVLVARSEAGINGKVYDFVSDWWDDEVEDPENNPLPEDHAEAVSRYFGEIATDETLDLESYEVSD